MKRANNFIYTLFGVLFSAAVSGCGYHLGEQAIAERFHDTTISIPYVNQDPDGQLTDELIKTFSASGIFQYRPKHGGLELSVKIIEQNNKCIGWRYNRTPNGKRNKDLINTEGRRSVEAEVILTDTSCDQVILGPLIVGASMDFDFYEPDSIRDLSFTNSAGVAQTSVTFSLGQLDSTEAAYDDVWIPLSKILAKNILDCVLRATYLSKED